jgi:hypothetical protein
MSGRTSESKFLRKCAPLLHRILVVCLERPSAKVAASAASDSEQTEGACLPCEAPMVQWTSVCGLDELEVETVQPTDSVSSSIEAVDQVPSTTCASQLQVRLAL